METDPPLQCFALVKQNMKPQSKGISRLIIPNPDNPNCEMTLYDPTIIENALKQHCQLHFKQAHGSPFMIPLLSTLLGYDGLSLFGQQLLNGSAPLDQLPINHATALLSKHQSYTTPTPGPHFQDVPF